MIDEVTIDLVGGRGGEGAVSFFPPKGKPSGGDGGHGGNIYGRIQPQMNSLSSYATTPHRKAASGSNGAAFTKRGKDADDLILYFPPGCVFEDIETEEKLHIEDGQDLLLCRGGAGGYGNARYHATHPGVFDKALHGKPGLTRKLKVALRLIADFGLIGKPNAGKSSLLNVLTKANSKVADYPFTTLTPALGILGAEKRAILADIPGLIEGASSGRGLGIRFLKHIEKVKGLIHCIPADSLDFVADYNEVRKEITEYSAELATKNEMILITKTDTVSEKVLHEVHAKALTLGSQVICVSILDEDSISKLSEHILSLEL